MKWLHNLLKGISLTGALFVFQACYGTPMPPIYEDGGVAFMSFTLVSHSTGEPLEGIRVLDKSIYDPVERGVTDSDGKCRIQFEYRRNIKGPVLRFEDPEGNYMVKDTTLADLRDRDILVKMDPAL